MSGVLRIPSLDDEFISSAVPRNRCAMASWENGDTRPDQVVAGSNKRYWWWCAKGPDHEWEATVDKRTSGRGCPVELWMDARQY